MTDIIIKWAIPFFLSTLYGYVATSMKKIKKDNKVIKEMTTIDIKTLKEVMEIDIKALKDSQVAMLRSQLTSKCETYLEKGFLPEYARYCLDDLFKNYTALGGNHGMEALVKQCFNLPPKQTNFGRRKEDKNG